ncbi:MAG TPA: hypothetical protein VFU43_14430 [Streptosporangiaceae bacterium]|nr:hypothetical protein [Streptosporangiaceae bacterium]
MRRSTTAAAVAVVLGTALAGAAAGGPAQARQTARSGCVLGGADFDGDTCGDLVVGDPAATVKGLANAGRINVLYGAATGTTGRRAVLAQGLPGVGDSAEAGDQFGAVLHAMRVDADPYADLVVGVPQESVGSAERAGIIQVIYGSADGLGAGRPGLVLRQSVFGIAGAPEAGDRFGAALGANTTRTDDGPAPAIAYGAPGEDIGTSADAGLAGLVVFDRDTGAVTAAGAIDQGSPGISGTVEAGDRFGQSVAVIQGPGGFSCPVTGTRGLTMAVGAPGEDFGSTADAGMVHVVRNLDGDSTLSQDTPGVDGAPEAGDQFGAALALTSECEHDGPSHIKLVVGTPGEDEGAIADSGMIHYFGTDDDELPLPHRWSVHQNSVDVADQSEAGDRFGAVLALGGPWRGDNVGQAIVVGVPREDVGATADAGAVHIFGDSLVAPGAADLFVTQAQAAEPVEAGDQFGAALAAYQDHLLIGAPDDVTHSTGLVHGLPWTQAGTGLSFVPGQDGVPADAVRFGAAVD